MGSTSSRRRSSHGVAISALLAIFWGALSGYNDYRFHTSLVWAAAWFLIWGALGFALNEFLGEALRVEPEPLPETVRKSAWMAFAFLAIFGVIWFSFERYIEQNGGAVSRTVPHSVRAPGR